MTNQTKTNNLNYLIDPKFIKVNRLFVLSFKNEEDRTSFSKHYTPKVDIKDFNVLINGKRFFDKPVKNKEEAYEKISEISKTNYYATVNLLDYEYFSKRYKLTAIDLSKKIELENSDLKQQINLLLKLKMIEQHCFSSFKNQKKQLLNFHEVLRISYNMETQKIMNLLNDLSNEESKFAAKQWYAIDSQTTKGKYKQGNTIKFETKSIKSSLCVCSDAYVLVTGNIIVNASNDTDVAFKSCAPFSTCKTENND